jgi:hypothetical protein
MRAPSRISNSGLGVCLQNALTTLCWAVALQRAGSMLDEVRSHGHGLQQLWNSTERLAREAKKTTKRSKLEI